MNNLMNQKMDGEDVLMGNLYDAQEYLAFTVKTDYRAVNGLEKIFDRLDLEPSNPEYLITVQKDAEKENRYIYELYCGFEHYGNRFWLAGRPYDGITDDRDIRTHAMLFVQEEEAAIDWKKAIKACIKH